MIKRISLCDGSNYQIGEKFFLGVITAIKPVKVKVAFVFIVYIENKPRIYVPYHAVVRWMEE